MLRVEYNQIIPLSSGSPPNAVCFNPHKPQIAIGINNQIEEYNVFTRARTNRTRIVTGKITHILFSQTHSYKIVFTDDGTLYVWEEDTNILTTRKAIKKAVACCAVSNLLPFLFYAKSGSKEITMFDLAGNRTCGKLDAKKATVMCATHPSKHLLVTASSDNSIRVIDYQAQRVIHTLEDFNRVTTSTTNIMSICFHPTLNYILSSGTSGTLLIWGDHSNDPTAPLQLLSKVSMGTNDIVSIGFHPWLPFLGVLQSNSDMQYFIVERNTSSSGEISYIQQCNLIKPFNLLDLEKSSQTDSLPDYAKHQFKWSLKPLNMLFHPKFNLLSFNYSYLLPNTGFIPLKLSIGQVIYSLFDSFDPQCIQYSVVSKHLFNRSHWLNVDTNKDYSYPNKIYLINNQKLRLYSVSLNETSVLSNLPSPTEDNKLRLYPVKLLHSDSNGILLVLFHYLVSNNNSIKKEKILERRLGIIRIKDPNKIIFCDFLDIRDVVLSIDTTILYVLHESQDKISKINIKDMLSSINSQDKINEINSIDTKSLKITSSIKIQRIFETPSNGQLLYYSVSQKSLFISLQQDISSVHNNKFICKEVITQIQCQDHPNLEFVIAIATISQIFILTSSLDIICSYKHTTNGKTPVIDSIMWIGNSLMFNTCNDIYYLTLDGDIHNLMSISIPYCNLTMLLNDRIIVSYLNQQNVELRSIPIGTLDPLLMGELAIKSKNIAVFQKLVSLHDKVRIGENLIKKLDDEGYSDLAFTLIENMSSPQIPYQIKFKIALRAQKFEKAFEILLIEKKNINFSTKAKTELFTFIKELSQICYHYGQLEIVKECYELLEDYYSLLNLYILTNYTAGISSLLDRAKRDGNNPLLLAACQRQLDLELTTTSTTTTTTAELFNWPLQSITNVTKWNTTDSTIAVMSTIALDNSSNKETPSTNSIKSLVLDDIKKYFPIDVSVKTVKSSSSSSSKILLHRSSKKLRTKTTRLEPLKPELITSSTPITQFPIALKPISRKPVTIATSTATIRKPLEDLLCNVPKKLPKLESLPDSNSTTSTSTSSTTTTPRESTDGSSVSRDVSPRPTTPNGAISDNENNNNVMPIVTTNNATTTTSNTVAAKPIRPPRPSSAAFTLIASTDISPLVPVSSLDLELSPTSTLNVPNPAEMASQILKNALPKLEKGLFSQSLEEVDKALLVLVESSEPSKYQSEIKYCIAYKLALGLLMDVKRLERESATPTTELLAKIGIRTKYLADLPLDPKHRVVCMRMAINKNIDAGNYGIASRLLEILIPKNLPDKNKLEEKLKICKQHFGADGNTPAFICPSCSNEVAAGIVACSCGRKIKFCFKTFELLTEPMYFSCSFCSSAFSTNSISNQQEDVICDLCKYGKLVKIE